MPPITLPDIRLAEHSLDSLPRLARLREQTMRAPVEVCIERAAHVTAYLRDLSDPAEPMELRYARAVNHFLTNKAPLFPDDNPLAGTTTSKYFGAPVYPELTGLTIWPELDTIGTRSQNPQRLSREDAARLNLDIFPYWLDRTILESTRAERGNPRCMQLFERIVFFLASKSGTISHTVPAYRMALERGLSAIITDAGARAAALEDTPEDRSKKVFYQAVQIALGGVVAYASRLAAAARERVATEVDPVRRAELLAMAEVCDHVPAQPPRTFREAVNALWLLQVGVHAESINMAISPGRLDQILYPYYEADLRAGRLTVAEAIELGGALWLKLNDNTNLVPETAEELFGGAGTVPAVTLGGVDEAGEDAVNDLTYVFLRVTELMKTRDPSVNARYHYDKNPAAYRDRVAEVIVSTRAVPAFHNDVVDIATLENQGTATAHARDYAVIGCVEMAAAGRSYDASSSIMLNLVSALELALYNGKRPVTGDEQIGPITGDPATFERYEQFLEAFHAQVRFLVGQAIELNEMLGLTHQRQLPTPLLSGLFEGPLDKGRDLIFGGALYNASGATHIGFADTVDSLNAIEALVFRDRAVAFSELIAALRANFEGHEILHARLVNRAPKYGTDDPIAIRNSRGLVRFLYGLYQGYTNYRGGRYRPAYWTMTNHAGQGKLTGALPNGRRASQVFASGITPASQAAPDLAAALKATGELGATWIPGGQALNMKYPAVQTDEDLQKFSAAIEAYMRYGGLHIQFNILSYETLLDARANPDKYPQLLVRVSGYSAYFKDLNDAMKNEIITRTAYDLRTGRIAPFPDADRDLLPFN